jgi:hypothetical protein
VSAEPSAPPAATSPSSNGAGRGAAELPGPSGLLGPVASVWRVRRLRSRRCAVLRDGAGRRHEVRLAELSRSRLLYALVEDRVALCLGVFRRGEGTGEEKDSAEEAVLREYASALADQRALAAMEGPRSAAAGPRFLSRPVLRSDLEEAEVRDGGDGGGRAAAAGR